MKSRGTFKATPHTGEKHCRFLNIEILWEKTVSEAKLFWQRNVKGIRAGKTQRENNDPSVMGMHPLGVVRACTWNDSSHLWEQHWAMGRTWLGAEKLGDLGTATKSALHFQGEALRWGVGPDRLCCPPWSISSMTFSSINLCDPEGPKVTRQFPCILRSVLTRSF